MNKFKGFHALIGDTPCYVLNATETHYKVRMGYYGQYHGWSGGARRDVSYTGGERWITKAEVTATGQS